MNSDSYKESHGECFDEDDLIQLAQGVSPHQDEMLQHVARCRKCGSSLRKYLHIFADEPWSLSEAAILDQLERSEIEKEAWLREHVFIARAADANTRVLTGVSPRLRSQSRWTVVVSLSAAAAAIVMGFVTVPLVVGTVEFSNAKKTLAAAWVEDRSTEIRFPDMPNAPIHPRPQIQGEASCSLRDLKRRPALLKANHAVLVNSRDPKWLQLEGRVLLMCGTPETIEDAIHTFETAGPLSPSLLIDLADAYFERELDAHPDHPNLKQTIDILIRVLQDPRLSRDEKPVALFNLAIAYEKSNWRDLALQTWDEYLDQYSSGDWANEARRHRDNVQSRTPLTQQQDPSSPEFFLGRLFRNELKPQDPEQYQRNALVLWMPQVLENQDSNEYLATTKLADEIKKKLPMRG